MQVASIKRLASGALSAEINGEKISGITEDTRFWIIVQEAIANGEVVVDCTPPVPTEAEQALIDLQVTDLELVKKCARLLEDDAAERIANGVPVPSGVSELISKREALRSKL